MQQRSFYVVFLSRIFNADNSDILLPDINIEPLIKPPSIFSLDLTYETISTDMMLITGNAATAIPQNQVIFYDTELVAVVHRSKARTTGLVSTTVWAWRGKRCTLGEKENGRLQELAKRYGTSAVRLLCISNLSYRFTVSCRTLSSNIRNLQSWCMCLVAN